MIERTPLTDRERAFLALVLRSPDVGHGWRSVSKTLWPMVEGFTRPELIETEPFPLGGGTVRLTEAGKIVARYL
jgi:hypothetical protein